MQVSFICTVFVEAVLFQCCRFQPQGQTYLISVSSSSTTDEAILRVSTDLASEISRVGPGRISSYCEGIGNGCDLLVLKGSNSSQAYTIFVPLENGAWMVTISIGSSVEIIGESALSFSRLCETLGVFHIFDSFVAICSDENDYLHYCDFNVDLNNASSYTDHCGGNPILFRTRFQRANGAPAPHAVLTGTSFETASVLMFSGKTLYHYSPSGSRIDPSSIPIDCDFITRVEQLNSNNGSAYLYCNDSRIYLYNLLDSSDVPMLIRNASEGIYPCNSGIYSLANLNLVYRLPGRNDLTIILSTPVVDGICIGTSSFLYEDMTSISIIRNMQDSLVHTTIDSRTQYQILQNSYVALFRPGSLSITDADTQDFKIFRSSSPEFPPLLYLLSVPAVTVTTLPSIDTASTVTTLQVGNATSQTATQNSSSQELPTSKQPPTTSGQQIGTVITVIVILIAVIISVVLGLLAAVIVSAFQCRRCCKQRTSDNDTPTIPLPERNSASPSTSDPELNASKSLSSVSNHSSPNFPRSVSESSVPNPPQSVSDTQSQGKSVLVAVPLSASRIPAQPVNESYYPRTKSHLSTPTTFNEDEDEATL